MSSAGIASAQQACPDKPIRFIVPFPPGGANNMLARPIGRELADNWGRAVVVDNRPGGNAIIGTEALARLRESGKT